MTVKKEQPRLFLQGSDVDELIQQIMKAATKEIFTSEKKEWEEKLLTVKETYRFLDISKTTLRNWTKSGRILSRKQGRRVYYLPSQILFLKKLAYLQELHPKLGERLASFFPKLPS